MKILLYSLMTLGLLSTIVSGCKSKDDEPVAPAPVDHNYDMDESALTAAGWTKTFTENFDGPLSTNWTVWKGGAYNNEYQYYSDADANVKVSNGQLVITAIRETVTGAREPGSSTTKTFDFTSGRIESKSTISASAATPKVRYAARIKLAPGYGMWPAFWSYGAAWPTNGEIDVLEAKGHLPMQYATNYFYGTTAGTNLVPYTAAATITSTTSLVDYWHVYEVVWEETKLTYYLDGKIVKTLTSDVSPGTYVDDMYGKTQKIVLNLAVGGDYFKNPNLPDPADIVTGTMYVDWVKVFTSN